MVQYLIVIAVVGVAMYLTGRRLFRQTKGEGCTGCNCKSKSHDFQKVLKTRTGADS